MERVVEQNFSFFNFNNQSFEDVIVIASNFCNARFESSTWYNCVFNGCQFNLALFDSSTFINCVFKSCEFINADLSSSEFKDCHAYLSTFFSVNFSKCKFGFISTDMCTFANARIGSECFIPASCREVVGEVIAQISSDPNIIAFAGLIKTYQEFCWETLIRIGRSFLSNKDAERIIDKLKSFKNFNNIIDKFDLKLIKGECNG